MIVMEIKDNAEIYILGDLNSWIKGKSHFGKRLLKVKQTMKNYVETLQNRL